jgi:23S rRNA (uracil1939-C5)-methyltransferase
VVFVANSANPDPLAACMDLIKDRLGKELHSLWFNANCGRVNTILGPEFQNWCGPPSVVERFGGAAVHYPPGAFGQNNLDMAQCIIEHVRTEVPQGARVAEFYAGVGAIGLSILDRVSEIRINEASSQSLQGLERGLAELDPVDRAKILLVPGEAGSAGDCASGAEVVIVDPPRKGLDPGLSLHLSGLPPERLVYISCGLESFIKDAAQLISRGTLRLAALTAFNLMPFTEHVEIAARFERI